MFAYHTRTLWSIIFVCLSYSHSMEYHFLFAYHTRTLWSIIFVCLSYSLSMEYHFCLPIILALYGVSFLFAYHTRTLWSIIFISYHTRTLWSIIFISYHTRTLWTVIFVCLSYPYSLEWCPYCSVGNLRSFYSRSAHLLYLKTRTNV